MLFTLREPLLALEGIRIPEPNIRCGSPSREDAHEEVPDDPRGGRARGRGVSCSRRVLGCSTPLLRARPRSHLPDHLPQVRRAAVDRAACRLDRSLTEGHVKLRVLIASAAVALAAFAVPSTAPAMTCAVANPTANAIVCDTVFRTVTPVLAPLCTGKLHACLG